MPKAEGYLFYDSARAITPEELQELYRFAYWGKSRTIDQIARMLVNSSMCFSVRHEGKVVAFCRVLTDFVFRASLWDFLVHPDHQGKGIGSALIDYALNHPAIKDIPLIITYTRDLAPFLERHGFEGDEGALILLRRPLEYS